MEVVLVTGIMMKLYIKIRRSIRGINELFLQIPLSLRLYTTMGSPGVPNELFFTHIFQLKQTKSRKKIIKKKQNKNMVVFYRSEVTRNKEEIEREEQSRICCEN